MKKSDKFTFDFQKFTKNYVWMVMCSASKNALFCQSVWYRLKQKSIT